MLQWRRLLTLILALWAAGWLLGNGLRLYVEKQLQQQPPAPVDRLDARLQALQRRHPNLAAIDREFLGQPLEETQSLLVTLALQAGTAAEFRETLDVLDGIRMRLRSQADIKAETLATLTTLEQRIQAVQAHGRLRRFPVQIQQPEGWTSDQGMRKRQIKERTHNPRLWVRISGGPLYWWKVKTELDRL